MKVFKVADFARFPDLAFIVMLLCIFFCLDAKESQNQGCKKMAKNGAPNLKFAKLA